MVFLGLTLICSSTGEIMGIFSDFFREITGVGNIMGYMNHH